MNNALTFWPTVIQTALLLVGIIWVLIKFDDSFANVAADVAVTMSYTVCISNICMRTPIFLPFHRDK